MKNMTYTLMIHYCYSLCSSDKATLIEVFHLLLETTDCRVWSGGDCGLLVVDCGLWSGRECGLATVECGVEGTVNY